MQTITELLAQELNCRQEYIANVIALLDEGNTIPFIARYRKEQHGAMDDTTLRTLETRLQYLRNLRPAPRGGQGLHRRAGKADGRAGTPPSTRPRRSPRSRTSTAPTSPSAARARPSPGKRASSRWRTLSLRQTLRHGPRPRRWPQDYLDPDKGVGDAGRRAGRARPTSSPSASPTTRPCARACAALMQRRRARRTSAAAKEGGRETAVYRLYYDFSQPISRLQGHQILALNRGETRGHAEGQRCGRPRSRRCSCMRRARGKARQPLRWTSCKAACEDSL